jgi:hypothetical protein
MISYGVNVTYTVAVVEHPEATSVSVTDTTPGPISPQGLYRFTFNVHGPRLIRWPVRLTDYSSRSVFLMHWNEIKIIYRVMNRHRNPRYDLQLPGHV